MSGALIPGLGATLLVWLLPWVGIWLLTVPWSVATWGGALGACFALWPGAWSVSRFRAALLGVQGCAAGAAAGAVVGFIWVGFGQAGTVGIDAERIGFGFVVLWGLFGLLVGAAIAFTPWTARGLDRRVALRAAGGALGAVAGAVLTLILQGVLGPLFGWVPDFLLYTCLLVPVAMGIGWLDSLTAGDRSTRWRAKHYRR